MEVTLFKRPDSKFYWMKWYDFAGTFYRVSTKSTTLRLAKQIARKKEEELIKGSGIVEIKSLTMKDLVEKVEQDYKKNSRKSLNKVHHRGNTIVDFFKNKRLVAITEIDIDDYIERRLENGRKPGTINRELALIKRGYNLLLEKKMIKQMPVIKMLAEDNVRTGFFEKWEYNTLMKHSPDYLQPVIQFAYVSGWRREEITNLGWSMVDLEAGIITLPVGYCKNKDGRVYPMDEDILELFRNLWTVRHFMLNVKEGYEEGFKNGYKSFNGKEYGQKVIGLPFWDTNYVFHNKNITNRLKDFHKAWNNACKDAEIVKRLFHDFRRTAVRNLIRSAVPEKIAMEITGHRTRSVFSRYNIVNTEDMKIAVEKQRIYLAKQSDEKPDDKPPEDMYLSKEKTKALEEIFDELEDLIE